MKTKIEKNLELLKSVRRDYGDPDKVITLWEGVGVSGGLNSDCIYDQDEINRAFGACKGAANFKKAYKSLLSYLAGVGYEVEHQAVGDIYLITGALCGGDYSHKARQCKFEFVVFVRK